MMKNRERTIRSLVIGTLTVAGAMAFGSSNPQADKLIEQGDAEVKAMHSPEALALFQQAAKEDPQNADILLRISQQYSNLIGQAKSPEEALDDAKQSLDAAKQAVVIAPDDPKAHLAVAIAYGRMTDFDDNRTKIEDSRLVKSEAEKTLDLDPREDIAYHVLGRWNYGVATLSPVMKLIAKYMYGGMPDASLVEAVMDYQKAIEIAPQRVIHHAELARTYTAMGNTADARKEWEIVLTLKPDDNESLNDEKEAKAALGK
jgi:tetratricopeptide (TPR) repeat protein